MEQNGSEEFECKAILSSDLGEFCQYLKHQDHAELLAELRQHQSVCSVRSLTLIDSCRLKVRPTSASVSPCEVAHPGTSDGYIGMRNFSLLIPSYPKSAKGPCETSRTITSYLKLPGLFS